MKGLIDQECGPDEGFKKAQNANPESRGGTDKINRRADESKAINRARDSMFLNCVFHFSFLQIRREWDSQPSVDHPPTFGW